jgi:hypothetical protein
MRSLIYFALGILGLAVACRFLLPGTWGIAIHLSGPIAKSYHYQSIVFWLVLAAGAVAFIVKLVGHIKH